AAAAANGGALAGSASPMPVLHPAPPAASNPGVEEAVIEDERTDPRVRIARALAAQDEQIRAAAEARKASAAAAAVQIPGTLQTEALPAPVATLGKGGDAAEVARRVGATPEMLTADTAVRAPPAGPEAATMKAAERA